MALSDKRILEEIKNGNIIIDPFNPEDLNTSSYDVRLGELYYFEHPRRSTNRGVDTHSSYHLYNPYSKSEVERVWGEPQRALPLREAIKKRGFKFEMDGKEWDEKEEGIKLDDLVILLKPGEMILAHTQEFIGGKNHITTSMQARSSQGRNFIAVCKCAGWGDVGYVNRWTMEISNFSKDCIIPLVVGRRYAQIVFIETGPILDKSYGENGKYQTGTNIETIKTSWEASMMLPRLDLDRDIQS